MKSLKLVLIFFTLLQVHQVNAQQTSSASHMLDIHVAEVALIDIYDSEILAEELKSSDIINFDLSELNGVAEAGSYSFKGISRTGLWLNYTSVVGDSGSGFDSERTIDVKMMVNGFGETFPQSLDLVIQPGNVSITTNGGNPGIAVDDVRLGKTNAIGTNVQLVNGIGSVYTGEGTKGFPLTYSLVQNGDFSKFKAGSYSAEIIYTLSDSN